ncbi:MAG: DUF6172 family protein [Verrucomicrobiota bacterium]
MKKTFQLTHPKIKYPRLVEGVKNEVRRYIKRERRKELPEGVDFWDFDCRFGDTEAEARGIHLSEIDGCINDAEARGLVSFYVEILAKEGIRSKKPKKGEALPKPELPKMKTFGEGS